MNNRKKENLVIIFIFIAYAIFLSFLATNATYKNQKYNFFSMEKNRVDYLNTGIKSCESYFYMLHQNKPILNLEDKVYDVKFRRNNSNKCIVEYKYKHMTGYQYVAISLLFVLITLILLMKIGFSTILTVLILILLFFGFIVIGLAYNIFKISFA